MPRNLFLIIIFVFQSIACMANREPDYILRLDDMLSKQEEINAAYRQKIWLHTAMLNSNMPIDEQHSLTKQIYELYSAFEYDSAYHYAMRRMNLSRQLCSQDDSTLLIDAKLDVLHILSVAGLFSEAEQMLQETERYFLTDKEQQERKDLYVKYLSYGNDLYLYKAEFADPPYSLQYISQAMQMRKRLTQVAEPNTYEYIFALAAYNAELGLLTDAIGLLEHLLAELQSGDRRYSIATGTLAFFYQFQGDKERTANYFALSAISDIQGSIRETNSLRALALLLNEQGDHRRAYQYLWASVRDAQEYGSRLRTFQTGQITPLIVQAWLVEQSRRQKAMYIIMLISLLFALLLAATVVIVLTYARKYHRANNEIKKRNKEIESINTQLAQMGKIKVEYLQRFMRLSSEYITEYELNRRNLLRLMRNNQTKELLAILNSPELAHRNVDKFTANFDEAFLNIYPTFIQQVNLLLKSDEQVRLQRGERMTTELRIMALIRLGINNNQDIAAILRSTMTTVYTYRSRLRLRAIDKDNFEQDIMQIE